MSVVEVGAAQTDELSPEAIEGLAMVLYCAGSRCVDAVNIALEVQSEIPEFDVARVVSARVGAACLSCQEISVVPSGKPIDHAAVDRILAEE